MSDDRRTDRRTLLGAGGLLLLGGVVGCSSTEPSGTSSTGADTSASASPSSVTASGATPSAFGGSPAAGIPSSSANPAEPAIVRTPGPDITSGPTTRAEVALTFHGQGDDAINRLIREALDQARAKATIFAVGTWVMADPQQVRAFRDAGHEIGNHTWSHLDMPSLDQASALTEIRKGREALEQVLGSAGWWFRPSSTTSSTETIRAAAAQAGYNRCVSYGVDPEDFREPGADVVRQRVAASVAAGSIVSLHLGHLGTAQALPGILEDLSVRGLRAVTLSTLLRD